MKSKKNIHDKALHSNKVFQTLVCLDVPVRKRLLRMLAAPGFNQSKTLLALCEILVDTLTQSDIGFDKAVVWKQLFGRKAYDDVVFRKYCSDLLKLIEAFLANENLFSSEEEQAMLTLDYVVKHRVEPLFSSALRQARASLEKQVYRTVNYYYKAYAIERQYYQMMDFDVKLDVRANLEEISRNLDLFYWIEKLKLYSAVLSQQKTGTHQYDLDFIQEIVAHLQVYPVESAPELAVYYYSFLTLYEPDKVEYYYKLRHLLDTYGRSMPQQEAIELFDSALHYCTGQLNKGNRVFLQEYFDVFEDAINKEVFIIQGELAPWRLNNVVGVALRLGKLEWAEAFIEAHKQYLPTETRINTYTFNLARVYRYQQKYDKVLATLRNIEYEDIGYNLISKAMLTITYYELEEFDTLDSLLESFRVFLNRHKNIPQQTRKIYLNLIKYTRRMTRLAPTDKAGVTALIEEITLEKANIVNHEWLLEKLAILA
ncbi:MAG: hypothetical protein NW218_02475 [Saprospiraceae bacterium]|nr:hypothetical protein [Saprospiraceae bacterium]